MSFIRLVVNGTRTSVFKERHPLVLKNDAKKSTLIRISGFILKKCLLEYHINPVFS